jgi:hypothetical protein
VAHARALEITQDRLQSLYDSGSAEAAATLPRAAEEEAALLNIGKGNTLP